VALALGTVIAEDPQLRHPPIELLFTVDEETGLTGAKKLAPGFVEGRILINLDSETEGVFTVGAPAAGMFRFAATCASPGAPKPPAAETDGPAACAAAIPESTFTGIGPTPTSCWPAPSTP